MGWPSWLAPQCGVSMNQPFDQTPLQAPLFRTMTVGQFIDKVNQYHYIFLDPGLLRMVSNPSDTGIMFLAHHLNRQFECNEFHPNHPDLYAIMLVLIERRYGLFRLKTVQPYFDDLGVKQFEVRKNDRDFAVGKWLQLAEYDAATDTYSGRYFLACISYILDSPDYCKEGYVVLQLTEMRLVNPESNQPFIEVLKW